MLRCHQICWVAALPEANAPDTMFPGTACCHPKLTLRQDPI
jgi:hypothetical protein